MGKLFEFSVTDLVVSTIAVVALVATVLQAFQSRNAERLHLLLGEKETAEYQALQIVQHARRRVPRVPDDVLHALILVTIFEVSDRARMLVYRALDSLKPRYEDHIVDYRRELVDSANEYRHAIDPASFDKRLAQLDAALPWITRR